MSYYLVLIPPRPGRPERGSPARPRSQWLYEVPVRTLENALALVRAHHGYGYTDTDYLEVEGSYDGHF